MCHYITATLPRDVDIDVVASRFDAHGRGFKVVSNPHVAGQIEPGDRYVLTTRKQCDCGTSLGTLSGSGAKSQAALAHQEGKLRRRGWSKAKIERWRTQTEQDRARREQQSVAGSQRGLQDARQWIALLRDLLNSGATARVGLLLHWYRGRVESERIVLKGVRRVELSMLTPDQVMAIEEDVLYEFLTFGEGGDPGD